MTKKNIICCGKCGKNLFYLSDRYTMSFKVTCVDCEGDKKPKAPSKTRRTMASNFSHTKKGVRKDIHPTYSFRSATEANFARILEYNKLKWAYEERAFTFSDYKTRPHIYVMDFEIKDGQKPPEDTNPR